MTTVAVPADPTVAVLGGTGDQGRGLAWRWASAGVRVTVGSRDPQRARAAAAELGVTGAGNAAAAAGADVVVVAVPWAGHAALLTELAATLAGKLVIDCVNPLGFDAQGPFALPVPEGSAAQQAQALLPDSVVVGAFHHVSAVHLLDPQHRLAVDTLVLGDDRAATGAVIALAQRIDGIRAIYGGRLRNAHQVEALTANLIAVNRRYQAHASIRITDV